MECHAKRNYIGRGNGGEGLLPLECWAEEQRRGISETKDQEWARRKFEGLRGLIYNGNITLLCSLRIVSASEVGALVLGVWWDPIWQSVATLHRLLVFSRVRILEWVCLTSVWVFIPTVSLERQFVRIYVLVRECIKHSIGRVPCYI